MNMKTNAKNLGAAGCGLVYILVFLFLPFIAVKFLQVGVSGMDLFSISALMYLPLVAGIVMMVCSLVAPKEAAAVTAAICAFIPLIVFFIVRSDVINGALSLTGIDLAGIGFGISNILTVGIGVVLDILLGIGCAILCWVSDYTKAVTRTPGLGASEDDEW